jgi:hypothetical protein
VSNPNTTPLGAWQVTVSAVSAELVRGSGPSGTETIPNGARGVGPVPGGGGFEVKFSLYYGWDAPDSISYTFNGVTTTVRLR